VSQMLKHCGEADGMNRGVAASQEKYGIYQPTPWTGPFLLSWIGFVLVLDRFLFLVLLSHHTVVRLGYLVYCAFVILFVRLRISQRRKKIGA